MGSAGPKEPRGRYSEDAPHVKAPSTQLGGQALCRRTHAHMEWYGVVTDRPSLSCACRSPMPNTTQCGDSQSACYPAPTCNSVGMCGGTPSRSFLCSAAYQTCNSTSGCAISSHLPFVCQLGPVDGRPAVESDFGCMIDHQCVPFNTSRSIDAPCVVSSVVGAAPVEQCTGAWVTTKGVGSCDCAGNTFKIDSGGKESNSAHRWWQVVCGPTC